MTVEVPLNFMATDKFKGVPHEESEDLVVGVQKMAVDTQLPDLNMQPPVAPKDRVSGLDSFMESSGTSESSPPVTGAGDRIGMAGMHQRFLMAKGGKVGASGERKFQLGVGSTTREIENQKKPKTVVHANILDSIKELEKNGLNSETAAQEAKDEKWATDGESPAKRSRLSPTHTTPLTGAHDEPRQEQ